MIAKVTKLSDIQLSPAQLKILRGEPLTRDEFFSLDEATRKMLGESPKISDEEMDKLEEVFEAWHKSLGINLNLFDEIS